MSIMHLLESSQDSQKLHKSRAALSYCVSDWQDSREERTFRVWLLSLLRNEVHIQNLAESLRDGYVLLRVLDTIAPGCVHWTAAHRPPFKPLLRQPKSIENCNQVHPASPYLLPADLLMSDSSRRALDALGRAAWLLRLTGSASLLTPCCKQLAQGLQHHRAALACKTQYWICLYTDRPLPACELKQSCAMTGGGHSAAGAGAAAGEHRRH